MATPLEMQELDKRFTYHPPKGDQQDRYVFLREQVKALAFNFVDKCPDSRERALALTKLEEAMMWANAAIARNE